jgi:hypothetical protein
LFSCLGFDKEEEGKKGKKEKKREIFFLFVYIHKSDVIILKSKSPHMNSSLPKTTKQ